MTTPAKTYIKMRSNLNNSKAFLWVEVVVLGRKSSFEGKKGKKGGVPRSVVAPICGYGQIVVNDDSIKLM
jgi:hypothetical protein